MSLSHLRLQAVLLALWQLGCAAARVECPAGEPGCACEAEARCNEGLRCSGGRCREADASDGSGGTAHFVEDDWPLPDEYDEYDEYDDGEPKAPCGDGIIIFPEQCDPAALSIPGCNTCQLTAGYMCTGEPSVCRETVCGDGVIEGTETCDDSNTVPFDGCDMSCRVEPDCNTKSGQGCTGSCGDGLAVAPETCDDGNRVPGDGCSEACQMEPGYRCVPRSNVEQSRNLDVMYRDFNAGAPSDFLAPETESEAAPCRGLVRGIAAPTLDSTGRPVFASAAAEACVSATGFAEWFSDSAHSSALPGTLVIFEDGYGYSSRFTPEGGFFTAADPEGGYQDVRGTPLFFPLDATLGALTPSEQYGPARVPPQIYFGLGSPWEAGGTTAEAPADSPLHNFHFTAELTLWFQFREQMSAQLSLAGDDDLFVYINRHLVLDLGGIHAPLRGTLTFTVDDGVQALIEEPMDPDHPSAAPMDPIQDTWTTDELGLLPGEIYEIKIFHAERRPPVSTLQLTLTGLDPDLSHCIGSCGDGILSVGEECDDGHGYNLGDYNGCWPDCTLGPFCGDGIVQREAGEECDDYDPASDIECFGCLRWRP
ncbi:MAG TPA: DUF4215 domain-containing protein [Polyangiaceae bacterium]|nr:DUF4215 domain-containing protein [Polyangiaceae bacterium]